MTSTPGITSPTPAVALTSAYVDSTVGELRPDYRALLIVVSGVRGGPSDEAGDAALSRAEASARTRLGGSPPETLPQIAAWREAFLGFGVKPRQARSSVEALLRRVDAGLPRIDRPTSVTADPGEVVWRDDLGVTCRRWNWRQSVRTRLGETTSDILFILDGLEPVGAAELETAGAALVEALTLDEPTASATSRVLGAPDGRLP